MGTKSMRTQTKTKIGLFKKGDQVVKLYHGMGGYREASLETVAKVTIAGSVELESGTGVTYSNKDGMEIEKFFLPIYSEILPLGN